MGDPIPFGRRLIVDHPVDDTQTDVDAPPDEKRSSLHVLVVDDDAMLRQVIVSFLLDQGFTVSSASDGAEALSTIEQQVPDLVLLDMYMPRMDGWALARELRARRMVLPVVVMTAALNARQQAQEIGAVAYVPKPVSLPGLVARLDTLSA